jgi:hypothetical protein
VVRVSQGGPTSTDNGQALCEACNHAKEAPGWSAWPAPGSRPGRHRVLTTTPTGHSYVSRPPPLPGGRPSHRTLLLLPDVARHSRLEMELAAMVAHVA